ncbi:MAG: AAA family ATPase [Spirochaetaceae bacterium]|nr:MAG: AAA family ATPase [Spirochaetaceae bacterium]
MIKTLKSELNPQQYEAVTTIDRPLLIIAGAGSGKTRVITQRIAYMLSRGVHQQNILALTFTNKAAREMQDRVKAITGKRLTQLTVSTFHAFGVQILRAYSQRLGYRDHFSIYDTVDQVSLLKETAREISFRLEEEDPKTILGLFSDLRTGRRVWDADTERYHHLFTDYRSHLKLYNSVDFDDLILLPIELFESHSDILEAVRERYRYILVDEFQDTSTKQYMFIKYIADGNRNICVVGDDDQSIYSWRGANFGNISQYEKDYPELLEVRLEQNYRSTTTILEAANGVIRNNTNRKDKHLWTGDDSGTAIEVYYPNDEREEAAFIAERIAETRLKDHLKYEDFGVLIRTNALSRAIEEAFLAANLPYRITGGTSFFDRKEIRDCISYMRLAANHDDDMSLLRVLNTPRRGIGRKTLEGLTDVARSHKCSLFSAIHLVCRPEDSSMNDRVKRDLTAFTDLIERYREKFLKSKRDLAAALTELVAEVDYWAYIVSEHQTNEKIAKWKYRNIELFIESLRRWERDPDNLDPGLFQWLNRISLQGRDDNQNETDSGQINLMTIHAAKGLEHEMVFLAGVEDGIIPHKRAIEEDPANIEEERRLFYVALTRAKRKLMITSCRTRSVMREISTMQPSPFLEEIPSHLMTMHEPSAPIQTTEAVDYFSLVRARLNNR